MGGRQRRCEILAPGIDRSTESRRQRLTADPYQSSTAGEAETKRDDFARKWDDADVVLTLKALERRDNGRLREIAAQNIPIYALKTNTTAQIQTCLKDLYDLPTVDDEELAMREAEEAVYKVMLHHKPVELSPQSSYVRRLQHQMVEKYHLLSRSTGIEPNRRVRVYKDAAQ